LGSSEKHGVPKGDQIYAILNASFATELVGEAQVGRIMLYIGPAHAQTDRELEILVHEFPETGQEAIIFHAMDLGPKFRPLREES
jgi:hypothetical protein